MIRTDIANRVARCCHFIGSTLPHAWQALAMQVAKLCQPYWQNFATRLAKTSFCINNAFTLPVKILYVGIKLLFPGCSA